MSDLISRKALLGKIESASVQVREIEDKKLLTIDLYDAIKLITNAPAIEQGEPVAYIHKHYLNEDKNALDWHKREHPQFEMISLYTAPPQPQEQDELVRKAMIKAAPTYEKEKG